MAHHQPRPATGQKNGKSARDFGQSPFLLEVTDILDLHTFNPAEVAGLVSTYLAEAYARGFSTVRIIHGKGTGAQRARVRTILQGAPLVARFQDAPEQAGGWGATLVWFKTEPEVAP